MRWLLPVVMVFPVAVLLAAGTSAEEPNVLTYPATFFAQARPDTAYDMIARLPGFVFNNGNTARGFAGTAGNVLIDGQRPTSKTDDLESILTRIPASDVERIDLIRGGAPGINMQGQTAIANVIRKKVDSTQIVADIEGTVFLDSHTVPKASLEYIRQSGDSTYEASITRFGDYDEAVGTGTHTLTDVQNGTSIVQPAHDNGVGAGFGLTGAATVPLFGGEFKTNLTLQDTPFRSAIFYEPPGVPEAIRNLSGDQNGELGLHRKGMLAGLEVESVLLQRLSHLSDINTLQAPNDSERFSSSSNTGESIARETVRYRPLDALTFEAGGEAAYNFLNGTSSFVQNGVDVPLPTPNPNVAEHRNEIFGQQTWKIAPDWLLEAGVRFELISAGRLASNGKACGWRRRRWRGNALMAGEKLLAAAQETSRLLLGASNDSVIKRYRKRVRANVRRLSK